MWFPARTPKSIPRNAALPAQVSVYLSEGVVDSTTVVLRYSGGYHNSKIYDVYYMTYY